jgi:hypothetical protein
MTLYVQLAKKKALLQGMTESLNKSGRSYGTEMNVEKFTVM